MPHRHTVPVGYVVAHAHHVDAPYHDDFQCSLPWDVPFERPDPQVTGAAALAHPAIIEAVMALYSCRGVEEADLTAQPIGDPDEFDYAMTALSAGQLLPVPERGVIGDRWAVIDTRHLRIDVLDAHTGDVVYEWTAATGWTSPHDTGLTPERVLTI